MGGKMYSFGTFTNGAADAGGDIDTGLRVCENLTLQHTAAAVVTNAAAINETFPCDGSAVTIVTDANADGIWFAIGEL